MSPQMRVNASKKSDPSQMEHGTRNAIIRGWNTSFNHKIKQTSPAVSNIASLCF